MEVGKGYNLVVYTMSSNSNDFVEVGVELPNGKKQLPMVVEKHARATLAPSYCVRGTLVKGMEHVWGEYMRFGHKDTKEVQSSGVPVFGQWGEEPEKGLLVYRESPSELGGGGWTIVPKRMADKSGVTYEISPDARYAVGTPLGVVRNQPVPSMEELSWTIWSPQEHAKYGHGVDGAWITDPNLQVVARMPGDPPCRTGPNDPGPLSTAAIVFIVLAVLVGLALMFTEAASRGLVPNVDKKNLEEYRPSTAIAGATVVLYGFAASSLQEMQKEMQKKSGPTGANTELGFMKTNHSNPAGTLPAGWEELYDDSTGKPYYYNERLQVTQWERP